MSLNHMLLSKRLTSCSCAAKYKSSKALRRDCALYHQLSQALIHTTDDISTDLVITLGTNSVSVKSDRAFIHHNTSDGTVKIYVPKDERQRRACYRSQLPELLTNILGVSSIATFNISSIVTSTLGDLEDVLIEQDIPPVEWIERPVVVISEGVEEERLVSPASVVENDDTVTLVDLQTGLATSTATPIGHGRMVSAVDVEHSVGTTPPAHYPEFIEQVVRSAQRAGYRYRDAEVPVANTPPRDEEFRDFDHQATFGNRNRNQFEHDRRIGAAGEAYVGVSFWTYQPPTDISLRCTKYSVASTYPISRKRTGAAPFVASSRHLHTSQTCRIGLAARLQI
jgi:hypothetical protein